MNMVNHRSFKDETSDQRARRLAYELADAMNDYDGGAWDAFVRPSGKYENPVWFKQDFERANDVDGELFKLGEKFYRARKAEDRAHDAHTPVEELFSKLRPKMPAPSVPEPEFPPDMTLGELRDPEHPIKSEFKKFDREKKKRTVAWEAECEKIRKECGLQKAEARQQRAMRRTDTAFWKVMETPARTLPGLQLKARVLEAHYRGVQIDEEAWDLISVDIRNGISCTS